MKRKYAIHFSLYCYDIELSLRYVLSVIVNVKTWLDDKNLIFKDFDFIIHTDSISYNKMIGIFVNEFGKDILNNKNLHFIIHDSSGKNNSKGMIWRFYGLCDTRYELNIAAEADTSMHINLDGFNEFIQSNALLYVRCYNIKCNPKICQRLALGGFVKFKTININSNKLILFKNIIQKFDNMLNDFEFAWDEYLLTRLLYFIFHNEKIILQVSNENEIINNNYDLYFQHIEKFVFSAVIRKEFIKQIPVQYNYYNLNFYNKQKKEYLYNNKIYTKSSALNRSKPENKTISTKNFLDLIYKETEI